MIEFCDKNQLVKFIDECKQKFQLNNWQVMTQPYGCSRIEFSLKK